MKTTLLILTALFFLSCSTDDYSGADKSLTVKETYRTQHPIDDVLIGEYAPYSKDYSGTVKITKDKLEYIGGTLEFKNYTTVSVITCYFDIYLSDGRVIRIQNRTNLGFIIILIKYPDGSTEQIGIYKPSKEIEEENPQIVNQ